MLPRLRRHLQVCARQSRVSCPDVVLCCLEHSAKRTAMVPTFFPDVGLAKFGLMWLGFAGLFADLAGIEALGLCVLPRLSVARLGAHAAATTKAAGE